MWCSCSVLGWNIEKAVLVAPTATGLRDNGLRTEAEGFSTRPSGALGALRKAISFFSFNLPERVENSFQGLRTEKGPVGPQCWLDAGVGIESTALS